MTPTKPLDLRLLLTLLLIPVLAAALAPAASADTKLVMKSHTDAYQMMGQSQPAEDSDVTFWIGDGEAARSDGDSTVIIRPGEKKLYLVNHGEKTYSEIDLPVDLMAVMPAETRKQMEPMMKAMEMTADVQAADDRQEINGWPTRLYEVTLSNSMGMNVASKVWVTEDVDVDLETFREMTKAMASLQPGGAAVAEELLEIEGVPVLMENEVQAMGSSMTSREELVSATTEDAPAGTYEVPEGYEKKEFDPMAGN